jgi:hypothetical protein
MDRPPLFSCHKLEEINDSFPLDISFPSMERPTVSEVTKADFFTCIQVKITNNIRANFSLVRPILARVYFSLMSPHQMEYVKALDGIQSVESF